MASPIVLHSPTKVSCTHGEPILTANWVQATKLIIFHPSWSLLNLESKVALMNYVTNLLMLSTVWFEYFRAVEIAACHLSHISAAMFHDGKIFMWGHCRGHSIYSPSPTPYSHLDEVFACYSTPAVTWRTLQFRARQDTPLAETLRLAFNDPVKLKHLLNDVLFPP